MKRGFFIFWKKTLWKLYMIVYNVVIYGKIELLCLTSDLGYCLAVLKFWRMFRAGSHCGRGKDIVRAKAASGESGNLGFFLRYIDERGQIECQQI